MINRLLSVRDIAEALHISRMQFYRLRPALIAAGLRPVRLTPDGRTRYTADSLNKLIRDAELNEQPILKNRKQIPLVVIGQGTSTTIIEGEN